jgi:hypothetical protein
MVRRDSAILLNVRRDSKQRALQAALLVPWSQLAEDAAAFAQWHIFVLWVRAIAEAAGHLPDLVRSTLRSRCPGFVEDQSRERNNSPLWSSLEEWIAAHCFPKARAEGWFEALMYYAYKDLRTEQAWTAWERAKADWRDTPPLRWPTLEEWTAEVLATRSLACPDAEKARAVEALGRVGGQRLNDAVTDLVLSRALALWVDCVSTPGQTLNESVLNELRRQCAGVPTTCFSDAVWGPPFFFRLVRFRDSGWRCTARREGWCAVLRYQLLQHPRYHRLIHYRQRCHDEWSYARPNFYPSFTDWLSDADGYCADRTA